MARKDSRRSSRVPLARKSGSTRAARTKAPVVTIRSAILSHYAPLCASLGINVPRMLKRVGLDAGCLFDPNLPIAATRAIELIERSAMESACQVFGLRLTLARGVPDIGPLNFLLREEPNLRSALHSIQSYLHLHSRSVRYVLEDDGRIATLSMSFAVQAPLPFAAAQSMEMVVCGTLQSIRSLLGANWSPTRVCLSHAGPKNDRQHRALLGCSVSFGQSFDGIVMQAKELDRAITYSNPNVRHYAEEYIKSLSRDTANFSGNVASLIAALLPSGRCSASTVAGHLGMDRSTMSRRLALVRESYSSLLQKTRIALASRSCLSGNSLSDVAIQLGFSDLSVFSRWFHTSFGSSARRWRDRHARV
jgi:AraC-like DNA-binding protein